MALTKTSVANARKELEIALAAVAAKTGIDFSIGIIRFSETEMRCKIEGIQRGATGATVPVSPKTAALSKYAFLLGSDFSEAKTYRSPTLGRVKIVGYNAKAIKYPFIVEQVATGKKYKIPTYTAKSVVAAGEVA